MNAQKIRDSYKDKTEARKALVYVAKEAQRAERFLDMVKIIQELISLLVSNAKDGSEMTEEERNLLSIAYKNVVGQLRAAHRTIIIDENAKYWNLAKIYKTDLEAELTLFCTNALQLFENVLNKVCCESYAARVFVHKLIADYYRYLAEFSPMNQEYKNKASKYYKLALQLAEGNLEATHPIRLGVALNFSVCFHEVMKDTKQACQLAKTAFNHAIAKLDDLDELLYKDSTLIMQLLRDNLTLWTADSSDR